jgi:hypothetical protein
MPVRAAAMRTATVHAAADRPTRRAAEPATPRSGARKAPAAERERPAAQRSAAKRVATKRPAAKRQAASVPAKRAAARGGKPALTLVKSTPTARNSAKRGGKITGRSVAALPPARVVKIKELNAQGKCGPGTSVVHLFRVDEVCNGTPAVHLVFFDRHGWYCEHGRTCPAVEDVRKVAGRPLARTN